MNNMQNNFLPAASTGGHLFTFNEIRDHKKNLMNSLKRKGALNGGIIPNKLGGSLQNNNEGGTAGGSYLPELNWPSTSNNVNAAA
jgi:hypothetical protein